MKFIRQSNISAIIFLLLLYGCAPLIGSHSQTAYENATSLKAEAIAILGKANTSYSENKESVETIELKIEKAYEFVKGIPNNQISTKQWEILKDPNGLLMGKFFKRWRARKTLSKPIIEQYKRLAAEAFDEIICLEANKKSATDCSQEGGSN
ncbi:hypothetical protein [Pseudoalteromonas fuliginea]|uniref:hypothetical protein n=1 Tax=Pseudoalteromonas fuliginea TaxID=1872678 RepID=UPI00317A3222